MSNWTRSGRRVWVSEAAPGRHLLNVMVGYAKFTLDDLTRQDLAELGAAISEEGANHLRYAVTISGRQVNIVRGAPSIRDVAINHCRTPMFAGHTRDFYSVAHHCMSCAAIAEACGCRMNVVLHCLLHEVEVALFGDVPGPMKPAQLRLAEAKVRDRTLATWGHPCTVQEEVETWDKIEQFASAALCGLQEPVYQEEWQRESQPVRETAMQVVEQMYREYPPDKQLGVDSELAAAFVRCYERAINAD